MSAISLCPPFAMSDSRFGLRRLLGLALSATCITVATCHDHWVDIWASMPQQVEIYNLPNAPYVSTSVHPPILGVPYQNGWNAY